MNQSTSHILLIRPSGFTFNTETAISNSFQNNIADIDEATIIKNVLEEFENFAATLQSKGVDVSIFNDTELPKKPDAVFPNNWITFHESGTIILYPMHAPNRRAEKRRDIIDTVKNRFIVNDVIDLSEYEKENKFLEGTGSMIFDHKNKIAYACLSPRTNKEVFIKVAGILGYEPIYFHAHNEKAKKIYHTNVMMCIAEKFAVICLDSITNKKEKELVSQALTQTGHQIIDITFEQMNQFAGNMLTLKTNKDDRLLVLSKSACIALTSIQKQQIEKYCEIIPLSINTIETIGGGSARCMIAEIFLSKK
jgi:hypothetical protein